VTRRPFTSMHDAVVTVFCSSFYTSFASWAAASKLLHRDASRRRRFQRMHGVSVYGGRVEPAEVLRAGTDLACCRMSSLHPQSAVREVRCFYWQRLTWGLLYS
jgi:hypothetical protein